MLGAMLTDIPMCENPSVEDLFVVTYCLRYGNSFVQDFQVFQISTVKDVMPYFKNCLLQGDHTFQ